ncbi:hypothetical protein Lser_V15G14416 [Lactuca serriola]
MDDVDDWDLYAIVKGIRPTIDASSSSFAAAITTTPTTTIPTKPTNNGQILDEINDWNIHALINDIYPAIDASSSSLDEIIPTTFIPTITTTPTIPENKSQVCDGLLNWNLDVMLNGLYPTTGASLSSFDVVSPTITKNTTTTTINTTPIVYLNDGQIFDVTTKWNLYATVNGFSPTIATSTPSIPMTNPIPITTTATQTIPTDFYNPQNSRFHGETSNQLQSTKENNVIKELMQISNSPLNFPNKHKRPLSCKNWPILSLPCLGKIPEPPNHQPLQQNQLQGRQLSLRIFEGTSKSKKREKDMKRIYKMPLQGLNTDVWSWKKYGEKKVVGSPRLRV